MNVAALLEEGGLLAAVVRPDAEPAGDPVVEAVREGYLLHHEAEGRFVATDDRDLALLAGDRLYALGLERLAAAGDLAAVAELADVIALSAAARARGDEDLAAAVWAAGEAALQARPAAGSPAAEAHAAAKTAARRADPSAACALRTVARQLDGHVAP